MSLEDIVQSSAQCIVGISLSILKIGTQIYKRSLSFPSIEIAKFLLWTSVAYVGTTIGE